MYDIVTNYFSHLQRLNWMAAVAIAVIGVAYLLAGLKIYKFLVMFNGLLFGALLGFWLGSKLKYPHLDWILGISLGVILAAAAWPLMRWAVSLMGALAGGAIGMALWNYISYAVGRPDVVGLRWVGALMGMIFMGMLTFIVFNLVVVIFTSGQGSFMLVSGVLSLLIAAGVLTQWANGGPSNHYVLPVLMLVPAVIGAVIQHSKFGGKPETK